MPYMMGCTKSDLKKVEEGFRRIDEARANIKQDMAALVGLMEKLKQGHVVLRIPQEVELGGESYYGVTVEINCSEGSWGIYRPETHRSTHSRFITGSAGDVDRRYTLDVEALLPEIFDLAIKADIPGLAKDLSFFRDIGKKSLERQQEPA